MPAASSQQPAATQRVRVIDSHTDGEPTRLVLSGGPDLGAGPLSERRLRFQSEYDSLRSAVVNEPRGSDALVGALLCSPVDSTCACGVIFFNNVGYLGMCGHGTIGLIVTLAHLGKITSGSHRIETPVGIISATLNPNGSVTVTNVPSYRYRAAVAVCVPGHGTITGDIAWGGNWFFLSANHGKAIEFANIEELTEFAWAIRQALHTSRITGAEGEEIDHIELSSDADAGSVSVLRSARSDSKNFVLCPGKAYDRSPCGTGTSAKLACLYADGKLQPGAIWRQEGIVGSVFEGSISIINGLIVPHITGTAFVTAEADLLLDPHDPLWMGIRR